MYKGATSTRRSAEDILADQIDYGRKRTGENLFKKKSFVPETKDVSAPEMKASPVTSKPKTKKPKHQSPIDKEPIRYCERCGKEISKAPYPAATQYRARKYCSSSCANAATMGKRIGKKKTQKPTVPHPDTKYALTKYHNEWDKINKALHIFGLSDRERGLCERAFGIGWECGLEEYSEWVDGVTI